MTRTPAYRPPGDLKNKESRPKAGRQVGMNPATRFPPEAECFCWDIERLMAAKQVAG